MVLSIIFLEDKHKIVLQLSIFYEYQQFFQHRNCFSIQPPDYSDPWPTLVRSTIFFLIMFFKNLIVRYIFLSLIKQLKDDWKGPPYTDINLAVWLTSIHDSVKSKTIELKYAATRTPSLGVQL
jgi:hypothetical protein